MARTQSREIVIYTTPTRPYCVMAKRYFAQHGLSFTDKDVGASHAALKELVERTGQYGVPVVVIGERTMVGWDKDEVDRMLAG